MTRYGIIVLLLSVFISGDVYAHDSELEQRLKAAYIFRISQFVKWPDLENERNLTICTLSQPALHKELIPLEKVTKSRYQFNVIEVKADTDISQCRILYLDDYQSDANTVLLADINSQPILTISSEMGFAQNIGVLEFVLTEDDLIKISINTDHVKQSGLVVDSRLLELATLVRGNK